MLRKIFIPFEMPAWWFLTSAFLFAGSLLAILYWTLF